MFSNPFYRKPAEQRQIRLEDRPAPASCFRGARFGRFRAFLLPGILAFCATALFLCRSEGGAEMGAAGSSESLSAGLAGEPESRLDLQKLEAGEIVRIRPVWDFYWGRLLRPQELQDHVPDARLEGMEIWKRLGYEGQGYATYRTLMDLPAHRPLAFRFSQQLTAVRIYIDGKDMGRHGLPGTSQDHTIPGRRNLIVEHQPGSQKTELVMQIANFHSFRGGARGVMEVGPVDRVLQSIRLEQALELLASGFLGAIALYHLFLFSLQRKEWVYLCFAALCLSFALRIPLLGEKTIHMLWPDVSWETQYRTNMGLNIFTPPLLILYFHLLFPGALHRRLFLAFLSVCGVFALSIFLDTVNLGRIMFAYYLIVAGPALLLGLYMVFRHGIRRKGSGRTMALGMAMVTVLGLMAIYQNWYTREDAAELAMLAFVAFGLFQALGVAQRHNESIEKEKSLATRLQKSREALSHQRQSLENDLHDSLGSRLVDLKLQATRNPVNLDSLKNQLNETYELFRGQLLFMEDLEYSSREPLTAIQLSVLRRYSAAGRELRFHMVERYRPLLEEFLADDSVRMDFLQLTRELCTNDLKYGEGESRWYLKLDEAGNVRLEQINRISVSSHWLPKHPDEKEEEGWDPVTWPGIAENGKGLAMHALTRIRRMGGVAHVRLIGRIFRFSARIPLPG